MRAALIVGIDHYFNLNSLQGCINDAYSVKSVLERHSSDGTINFDCNLLVSNGSERGVTTRGLKKSLEDLFEKELDVALFYFAGHGSLEREDGYIITSEAEDSDGGVPLSTILKFANESPAKNKVIILDSCHSGQMGNYNGKNDAALSEGITVLTASSRDEFANEINGSGVFTQLFVDALEGSASDILGQITPGSIYAHIDQSLGAWEQRPIFKTNVRQFVSLRNTAPKISIEDLKQINILFPSSGYQYQLDPTYEPELKGRSKGMPNPKDENVRKFKILQKYNRLNLVVPVEAEHMWNAAMESKFCKLTSLGEHYRKLVEKGRI